LRRLGLASPPPFVGRTRELEALVEALSDSLLVVVTGVVGVGKTRLVAELCTREQVAELSPVRVRCRPGDRGEAVRARAERELGALPGELDATLRDEPRLLVIDDAHHLIDAPDMLRSLAIEPGAGRVLLIASERLPLRRAQSQRFELALEGLAEPAARELWAHLEESYGPTRSDACDQALLVTGGVPLGLRREYARATAGDGAWNVVELPAGSRELLEIMAVLHIAVAPAGLAALASDSDIEVALVDLITRQLVDPLPDGRFHLHDVVTHQVLDALDNERLVELASRAAAQFAGEGERGSGVFGMLDPVDRMREAARHWLAAGEPGKAADLIAASFSDAAARGSSGEVTALARAVETADPTLAPRLRAVRARAARRRGALVEALELGGTGDPVTDCWLRFQCGEVEVARTALEQLADSDPVTAARASARLSRIEVEAGAVETAAARISECFRRAADDLDGHARAHLHLAAADAALAQGDPTSARAALARARGAGDVGAELTAAIDLMRARLLGLEGRAGEATELLEKTAGIVAQLDLGVLADEVVRLRAQLAARAGDLGGAAERLRRLVSRHRERGNELPALRAELDLASTQLARGELANASELASAAARGAAARGLDALRERAELLSAKIDLAVYRLEPAAEVLAACEKSQCAQTRAGAAASLRLLAARAGEQLPKQSGRPGDPIGATAEAIRIAVAQRDTVGALKLAREQAAAAERAGRLGELVEALAVLARLQIARGDRAAATAAASRAAREALMCGMTAARADALLVLAALSRDNSELTAAQAYAQDAAELAQAAGLPLRRLAAARAMEVIALGDQGGVAQIAEREAAAAAAMSEAAVEAAAQLLADLGLTSARPYRVVTATGAESFVADASPSVLRMEERDLVIDAVREVIVRGGDEIADLRRRSLLKRLLFLFARSPGEVFSKEEIVQSVWEVDYHPLRHDAALFTNIMRIRRLLGKDGADLIRVSDEGYRFCPEKDFLYVEPVPEA
jgi:hypothetical protein